MCGVSGVELLIIIVAAVIILGPDKLPELMRQFGRLARQLRSLSGELQKTASLEEIREQIRKDVQVDRLRAAKPELENEIDAIRKRLNKVTEPPTKRDASESGAVDGAERPIESDGDEDATTTTPPAATVPAARGRGGRLVSPAPPADREESESPGTAKSKSGRASDAVASGGATGEETEP